MRPLLVIVLISLSSVLTVAQTPRATCTNRDFSPSLGPVRNQGSKGWCFAFAAADLIGHRLGVVPGEQISAMDVALSYYFPHDLSSLEERFATLPPGAMRDGLASYLDKQRSSGTASVLMAPDPLVVATGSTSEAISKYQFRTGFCTERQLPTQGVRSEKPGSPSVDDINFIDRRLNQVFQDQVEAGDSARQCVASPLAPFGQFDQLRGYVHYQASLDLNRWANRECAPRREMPFFQGRSLRRGDSDMIARMNSLIDQETPIGIGYDACFLMNGCSDRVEAHASVVVGRRFDPSSGQCQFKIRNSWGPGCDYPAPWNERCEGGHIWVDEETLQRSLTTVEWVE